MKHDKKIKPETPDYIKFKNKILRKDEATQSHHPRPDDAYPPSTAILAHAHPPQYQIYK
jgi:hypothetical protein